VRYPVYDSNVLVNRLLRTALEVAARAPVTAPLLARVLAILPRFEAACAIEPKADTFDRLALTRSTERYREALLLARMLLEGLAPALRQGKVPVFSLLFDMNVLWERYVGVLFQRVRAPGVRVTRQDKRGFWIPEASHERVIRPDIVISNEHSPKVFAVLDTKWKLAKSKGPDDDDLKQMFAYNEIFNAPSAFLLYPTPGSVALGVTGLFSVTKGHQCSMVELMLEHQGRARTAAIQQQVRQLVELIRSSSVAKTQRSST
jgi:5-methylcytosine-specific restriction enzyme subunit McrC